MSAKIQERIDAYAFFVNLFMTLPDEEFARAALDEATEGAPSGEPDASEKAFLAFRDGNAGRDIADVLLDLSIDRTQLLRGVREDGIRPPYESLYIDVKSESSCLAIVRAYKAAGLGVSEAVKESPEYIGCEMGFMLELCRREQSAIEAADPKAVGLAREAQASFFSDHLGRWAGAFAAAMVDAARTGFYKGVAYLLSDFIEEERLQFSAD